MQLRSSLLALSLIATVAMGARVQAAEIIILANQGAVSGVRDLAAGFEQKTGNKVKVVFAQGSEMAAMIDGNEPADLISQFLDQFDDLVKRGKVVPGASAE